MKIIISLLLVLLEIIICDAQHTKQTPFEAKCIDSFVIDKIVFWDDATKEKDTSFYWNYRLDYYDLNKFTPPLKDSIAKILHDVSLYNDGFEEAIHFCRNYAIKSNRSSHLFSFYASFEKVHESANYFTTAFSSIKNFGGDSLETNLDYFVFNKKTGKKATYSDFFRMDKMQELKTLNEVYYKHTNAETIGDTTNFRRIRDCVICKTAKEFPLANNFYFDDKGLYINYNRKDGLMKTRYTIPISEIENLLK